MKTCRHCMMKVATRPRGLCATCYYRPGVKEQYPSESPFAPHEGDVYRDAPLPEPYLDVLPGSDAKILILRERVRKRESLFHPAEIRQSMSRRRLRVIRYRGPRDGGQRERMVG